MKTVLRIIGIILLILVILVAVVAAGGYIFIQQKFAKLQNRKTGKETAKH